VSSILKYVSTDIFMSKEVDFMDDMIYLEDDEWVVKGPHYYLIERRPIEEIEKEIYRLLEEHGPMPLSALWRKLNCHLWEVSAALRRLKSKGLIEEGEASPESYRKSEV